MEHEGDEHDDSGECEPPDAARVRRRAWALATVAIRAHLESGAGDDAGRAWHDALRAWIERTGTGDELEPEERELIDAPLGTLERRRIIDASWRIEGAAVLAWVLGLFELPGHDRKVATDELLVALEVDPEVPPAPSTPRRRSDEELDREARRQLGLHWRMRQLGARPGPVDFAAFARGSWFGGFDLDGIALAGGDLAIGGVAITEAGVDQVETASSIASERHRAIEWARGDHPIYSWVDTST